MEQAGKGEMVAIPIFYKVEPEDVRKQKGEFGEEFLRHAQESSCEQIEKWQVALKAVSDNVGFTLDPYRYVYIMNSFLILLVRVPPIPVQCLKSVCNF